MTEVNALSLIFSDRDINSVTSSDTFEITSLVRLDCITFNITDDKIVEGTENFIITLVQGSSEVMFVNDLVTIVINDNDGKTCIDVECRNVQLV